MPRQRPLPPLRLLPLLLALGASVPVQAQSLVDLYDAARSYDATYQSAKSQYDATMAKAAQAKAAILPTAGLTASANQINQDNQLPTSSAKNYNYTSQTTTLAVSQPLYRPANWASYEQGNKSIELAQAQLTAAEQDLIVRVSQAYFDVLASRDNVALEIGRASCRERV